MITTIIRHAKIVNEHSVLLGWTILENVPSNPALWIRKPVE
jgi:hypothetical protein